MQIWSRLLNASRAFLDTFNERALIPGEDFGWDSLEARLFRYRHNAAYYNNVIYDPITRYSSLYKARMGMYKESRGVYNPIGRQNDLLVSYVYGGGLDLEHMTGGAIPLACDNKALINALRQVFISSQMGSLKSLYVRWGALFGDVILNVVDEPSKQKTYVEVLHPAKVAQAKFDEIGNTKAITYQYEREDDPYVSISEQGNSGFLRPGGSLNEPYLYTQTIEHDPDDEQIIVYRTYKNKEPFAYFFDANGEPIQEWRRPYGFIPAVVANHKSVGLHWGESSFHNSRRKIDEVNDFASLLNDQVRKSVNAMWYFAGVRSNDELDASTNNRDEIAAIYGPADSQPFPMVANLPIDQAIHNLEMMLAELENDMPELALQHIRENGSSLTAPGVRSGYSDAIGRIEEARGNYDQALVRALQMAVSIGGYNGYKNFEGFTLDSYKSGDLDFTIKDRPVIDDTLSKNEKLTTLGSISNQPAAIQKLMLKELEYSDDEIKAVVADMQTEKQANIVAQQAQQPTGTPNDPNAQAADERQMADVWAAIGLPSPQQAQAVAA